MHKSQILIFDHSDQKVSAKISSILTEEKHNSIIIQSVEHINHIDLNNIQLIFFHLHNIESYNLFNVYEKFFENRPQIPVIGVLDTSKIMDNKSLFNKYIWNFISIPFNKQDIILNLEKYCYHKSDIKNSNINSLIKRKIGFDLLIGDSEQICKVKHKLFDVASYDVNVLLKGETGTGKELCAKLIHFLSSRSSKPFIPVNCGAIPKELFENELFGHKKGAYTNADTSEKGVVSAANEGTLFLDEIESLQESIQVKLLRFLEEKKYKPLGQAKYCDADVRIIAAAKENLWEKVQKNQFREDLFYRLSVIKIFLPSLSERTDDIPLLVSYFIDRYSTLYKKKIKGVKSAALLKLIHNDWSGNVRQLENTIQEAVVTCQTEWIDTNDIVLINEDNDTNTELLTFNTAKQKSIYEFEQKYLENIMRITCGNISKAAKTANKDRRAFYRLLKKHTINPVEFRT